MAFDKVKLAKESLQIHNFLDSIIQGILNSLVLHVLFYLISLFSYFSWFLILLQIILKTTKYM